MRMTLGSQPHPPVSPSDSGYGSTSTTPERPALAPPDDQPSHGSIPPLRGNGVRNSPEATDSDNTFGILAHPDISVPLEEPTTLALSGSASLSPIPKRSPPQKGFDDSRASAKVRATCLKVSPLWLPDRFVPVRGQSAVDIDKFRTSKPVAELTPAEKILRNGDATPDPFGSPRVGANAVPPGYPSSAPGPDNRIFDTGDFSQPSISYSNSLTLAQTGQLLTLFRGIPSGPGEARSANPYSNFLVPCVLESLSLL